MSEVLGTCASEARRRIIYLTKSLTQLEGVYLKKDHHRKIDSRRRSQREAIEGRGSSMKIT